MVIRESACVQCGCDCRYCTLAGKEVEYIVCDNCEEECVDYRYEGRDYCETCLFEVFRKEYEVPEYLDIDALESEEGLEELFNDWERFKEYARI